jgi:hypothetical protein
VKKGGSGGAKTQKSGADFEVSTADSFISDLMQLGFKVDSKHRRSPRSSTLHGVSLSKTNEQKLEIFYQDGIYKLFFEPLGVDWKTYFSSRLKPDSAIYSTSTRVLTVIEKKQQNVEGSVAEKLQTCDYKLNYYKKLTKPLDVEVNLIWLLGPYFENKKDSLRSVFEYMLEKGSRYYFGNIPISELCI